MVLNLSSHNAHSGGESSSPFNGRRSMTAFSSNNGNNRANGSGGGAFHRHSNIGDSSSGSNSSNTFAGIVNAAKFSKKLIAKRMSAMSESSKNKSEMGDSSRTQNSATDHARRQRQQSVILMDPHKHLRTIITTESSPFLSQFMEYPIPAPSMARNALQLGKLLQDGDYCQLQEVTGFKSRSPQQRQHPYAIKTINPRLFVRSDESQGSDEDGTNENESLERAATKLVLEGLYLGHLQHPHILKLRGVAMGGMAAEPEALFLLTDRLGDTLDQRIDTWKQWAAAKEKLEKKRQRRVQYPPLAPSTGGVNLNKDGPENVLNDKTIKTYPEDLIVLKTNYALQILDALQYLHERGIVVRELRPESVGFCAYPHHHTVQLCDLSSCKEVPRDGSQIAPEIIESRPSLMDGSSVSHTGSHTTHTRGGDRDATETSYTNSDQQPHNADALLGVRTTVAARRYMAPEIYGDEGYNTKADLYSWAMVFSELVTETKPYSSRQLMRDWTKIVRGILRPKLQKYHFPRTIKGVLELAWQANVAKRGTAKQLHKSLTTVLHMLEGQGLPWLADPLSSSQQHQQTQAAAAAAAAAAIAGATANASGAGAQPNRRSRMMRQKTLTRESLTLAAQSSIMNRNTSLRCSTTDAPLTLPQRAVHYKRLQAKEPVGWGKVWDPRAGNLDEINGDGIQATVQSNKDQVFQRRYKANRIEGI